MSKVLEFESCRVSLLVCQEGSGVLAMPKRGRYGISLKYTQPVLVVLLCWGMVVAILGICFFVLGLLWVIMCSLTVIVKPEQNTQTFG